jgi:hypothetical protein
MQQHVLGLSVGLGFGPGSRLGYFLVNLALQSLDGVFGN